MAKNNKKNGTKRSSFGKMLFRGVKAVAGPLIFVEQVTHKDRDTMGDAFNSAPIGQKGKILINIVLGRVLGISPFGDEVQAPQTINFSGIFNRWTGLGIGLKLYAIISRSVKVQGKSVLPHGSKLDQLGTQALTGGAFGGLFDAPGGDSSLKSSRATTKHIKLIGSVTTSHLSSPQISTPQERNIQSALLSPITVPDSAMGGLE